MVSVPVEGAWSLRSVGDADLREVLAFLEREPLINIYLASRLLDDPIVAAAQMVAVRHERSIVAVAALATNVVLAGAPDVPQPVLGCAIDLIANRILGQMLPVRAIISPAHLVEMLWSRLRTRVDPPTVVRMNQPIYALTPRDGFPTLSRARFSTRYDLDRLVPACAAMHREEVGIDPMERDAAGYRERIRELSELRRSIVLVQDGEIAAKCEFSAVTATAVQLMGVWTHPRFRRRGLAAELLRETCGHLFREGKIVTLFVNDFNAPAIALYESLGFVRIGVNRALIW
jgi:RimJ/RimL family protein N-acetyltransferase